MAMIPHTVMNKREAPRANSMVEVPRSPRKPDLLRPVDRAKMTASDQRSHGCATCMSAEPFAVNVVGSPGQWKSGVIVDDVFT